MNIRAIKEVAKRDFLGFYFSARAPLLIFVFLFIMGIFFYTFVAEVVEGQQKSMGMGGAPGVDQLLLALYSNVNFLMLLIVPGVTMSSFADEMRSHTFRFLQSSPISSTDIVLGKFFALSGVVWSALALTLVFPLYLFLYSEPQLSIVVLSYLGVGCLMASQVAFGMFISSLTDNQLLAFLFSMLGLFILFILSFVAPHLSSGAMSEGILQYLATTRHLEPFLKGLLGLQHCVYFMIFVCFFLFLTTAVIDSRRWR